MRILITGATGMLGSYLIKYFRKQYEVYATGRTKCESLGVSYMPFDLSEGDYRLLINWSKPDLIIHSGALTNGNYCQNNPEEAFKVNALSVQKIIEETEDKVKIMYISTDAVFPANLSKAKEKDIVSPENIYGKSKELGEFYLRNSNNRKYSILRTTIVGLNTLKGRKSFVEWIIKSSTNNQRFSLFKDVFFSPISIWSLANEISFLILNDIFENEILHIAGESITKYEFGLKLLNSLELQKNTLNESSILSFKSRAQRSTDQTLDSSYYSEKYNRQLPNVIDTISLIKKHYEQNKIRL